MTVARCTIPALAVCLAWLSVGGQAQQPTPAFDVVSVRPNTSTDGTIDIPPTPPEGVVLHNRSVADVIRYAYQLPSFRVFGLPRWTEDERFDIVAKAAGAITEDQRQAMVRTLLATRFRLKAHFEKRDQTIYVMTRARADGSLGTGLRPRPDCVTTPCQRSGSSSRVAGVIRLRGTTMAGLADGPMSSILGQVVRDESGIEGVFDVQASWRPDAVDAAIVPNDERPSFFTAIQEQLGLRLEPRREAVEVLVVESVERPTPD
ncbi:MAG: TIGR03435 family protein [Vicinamibacterales bacterium]